MIRVPVDKILYTVVWGAFVLATELGKWWLAAKVLRLWTGK